MPGPRQQRDLLMSPPTFDDRMLPPGQGLVSGSRWPTGIRLIPFFDPFMRVTVIHLRSRR